MKRTERTKSWWRRWLHNATGDRQREAEALAADVTDHTVAPVGDQTVLHDAKEAVAIAHGDGGLPPTSESQIATTDDVVRVAEHREEERRS